MVMLKKVHVKSLVNERIRLSSFDLFKGSGNEMPTRGDEEKLFLNAHGRKAVFLESAQISASYQLGLLPFSSAEFVVFFYLTGVHSALYVLHHLCS